MPLDFNAAVEGTDLHVSFP